MKIYSTIFILLCPLLIFSIDRNLIDSLRYERSNCSTISSCDEIDVKIANHFIYHNLDSAASYINPIISRTDTTKFNKEYYERYMVKAWLHHGNQELITAKAYYQKAIIIANKHLSRKKTIEMKVNLGSLLVQMNDTTAYTYALGLIQDVDQTFPNDDERTMWILGKQYIAKININRFKYRKALNLLLEILRSPHIEKLPKYRYGTLKLFTMILKNVGDKELALKYLKENLDADLYDYERKTLLGHMAELLINLDSLDSANKYLNEFAALSPFTKDERQKYNYCRALLFKEKSLIQNALSHIEIAINCADSIENVEIQLRNRLFAAKLNLEIGNDFTVSNLMVEIDSILKRSGDLPLDIGIRVEELAFESKLQGSLSSLYSDYQNLSKAKNTLHTEIQERTTKELVRAYESEIKDIEIEKLQLIANQQNSLSRVFKWLLISTGILMILIILYTRHIYLVNRLRKENNEYLERENNELVFKSEELGLLNRNLEERLFNTKNKIEGSFQINSGYKIYKFNFKDVLYIKAEDNGCRIFYKNESIWLYERLKTLLEKLPSSIFVKIHRATIVNLNHFEEFDQRSIKISDGSILRVSKSYREELLKFIKQG